MKIIEKWLTSIKNLCEKNTFLAKCYSLCEKNSELIKYAFWGVLTTLFNMLIYIISSRLLFNFIFTENFSLSFLNIFSGEEIIREYTPTALVALASNALAWFLAVAFAFFVNQKWVFNDNSSGAKRLGKLLGFYLLRAVSGLFEIILPSLMIIVFSINDILAKIIVSVLVIILNYLFSKFITFRKSKTG